MIEKTILLIDKLEANVRVLRAVLKALPKEDAGLLNRLEVAIEQINWSIDDLEDHYGIKDEKSSLQMR